jgi:hypothetical protein
LRKLAQRVSNVIAALVIGVAAWLNASVPRGLNSGCIWP